MRPPAIALVLTALALTVQSGQAQDIETAARVMRRELPLGYFEAKRRDPDLFELSHGWIVRSQQAQLAGLPLGGRLPVVVIPALFANSGTPRFSATELQRALFDGPAPYGTLAGFYAEASYGRLSVTGQVAPWVRSDLTMSEVVGDSYGLGGTTRIRDYLRQALAKADPVIDFRQFDNDGADGIPNSVDDDGRVDATAFLFLEQAASCGGPAIWPHRSRISAVDGIPYASNDLRPNGQPVVVDDYIIQGATDCSGAEILPPSTTAHELGHVLGLPDLYDAFDGILPEERRWILGCWELMAAGAWGCGSGGTFLGGRRPPHFGTWTKGVLGWVSPQVVGSVRDAEFSLRPTHMAADVLRVPLGPREYIELQYRRRAGYDAELPGSGVLIHHVETGRAWRPCAGCSRRYSIGLDEADGNDKLVRTTLEGGNRGEAGDAFGVSGPTSYSNATVPALRTNAGAITTVTIHSITLDETSGVARIRISTAPTPAIVSASPLAAVPALTALDVRVRAAGGALPYRWSVLGALPEGASWAGQTDQLVLSGTPLESGAFPLAVSLRDALGNTLSQTVTLTVTQPVFQVAHLTEPFVGNGASPLTAPERTYLDLSGNRNGRYDIGDLRTWLVGHP